MSSIVLVRCQLKQHMSLFQFHHFIIFLLYFRNCFARNQIPHNYTFEEFSTSLFECYANYFSFLLFSAVGITTFLFVILFAILAWKFIVYQVAFFSPFLFLFFPLFYLLQMEWWTKINYIKSMMYSSSFILSTNMCLSISLCIFTSSFSPFL